MTMLEKIAAAIKAACPLTPHDQVAMHMARAAVQTMLDSLTDEHMRSECAEDFLQDILEEHPDEPQTGVPVEVWRNFYRG